VATSVFVNQSLPAGIFVVSNYVSQGSNYISGSSMSCNLGTLGVGGKATILLVATSSISGTLSTTLNVSGSQPDPATANNSATITTLVSVPFLSVAASGATLTSESFSPTNGAIDI